MKQSNILTFGFIIGLAVLLLNDLVLKDYFQNWWTGKLSDFAGLFIFPIFLTLFNSSRIVWNYLFTILLFIFWKTELSTPFLDELNNLTHLGFARVVDYTDFMAFSILPLSYYYSKHAQALKIHQLKPLLVCISIFSFYATSAPDMQSENEKIIVGRYHRIWTDEGYEKLVMGIGFQDNDSKGCYSIVLGPDIISYGFNQDYIIAKINPEVGDHKIDTSKTEYAILVVEKDITAILGDEQVFKGLNLDQFNSKRKELGIPDSVVLKER
jgi:hypothetical protein